VTDRRSFFIQASILLREKWAREKSVPITALAPDLNSFTASEKTSKTQFQFKNYSVFSYHSLFTKRELFSSTNLWNIFQGALDIAELHEVHWSSRVDIENLQCQRRSPSPPLEETVLNQNLKQQMWQPGTRFHPLHHIDSPKSGNRAHFPTISSF
jgi:hypothetical protein